MVVILAAGKGSRMNLDPGISKCSVILPDGRSSVRRLIDQFKDLGESNFIVVVGYGAESVVRGVGEVEGVSVCFVYNGSYETRGCEYSLSCSYPVIDTNEELIVVEGDLVTTRENLSKIVEYRDNAVLVRPSNFLCNRSVAVVCTDNSFRVLKFLYDKDHEFDMRSITKVAPETYDSFQVWKITTGSSIKDFKGLLRYYKESSEISCDEEFMFASGLLSFNNFVSRHAMFTIPVTCPEAWMNMNSQEDVEFLGSEDCSWYNSI